MKQSCCGCGNASATKRSLFSRLKMHFESPWYLLLAFLSLAISFLLNHGHEHHAPFTFTLANALTLIAVATCGYPLFYEGVHAIVKGKLKSSVLISLAIVAALGIGEWFAAGEVAFLMALGEWLEHITTQKAKQGIDALVKLLPKTVMVQENGIEIEKPIDEIALFSRVHVRPGEMIALDGTVLEGESSLNQANMTGESLPVDIKKGDKVFSGTQNLNGSFIMQVESLSQDSTMQKMIALLNSVDDKHTHIETLVDKWASYLVPLALFVAVLTFAFTGDIVRAVSVLVVFCPCAFALATPTCMVAAIGQASNKGVLIKNKNALDILATCKQFAFDKTGTLTQGELTVTDIIPEAPFTKADILTLCASLEQHSEHPIAKAILKLAKNTLPVENFKAISGFGVEGVIDGTLYTLGKKQTPHTENLATEGKTCMVLSKQGESIATLALADTLKPTTQAMLKRLQVLGVENTLLSGDSSQACTFITQGLALKHVYANLLPQDKVKQIQALQKQGTVAMVGDGLNDALALKQADVSIAMASLGNDTSINIADIALVGDDVGKIPYIKKLATKTLRSIKFNLSLSMLINFVAVILSVLGLLGPVAGALVHNLGSVLVTLNGALLYKRKIN